MKDIYKFHNILIRTIILFVCISTLNTILSAHSCINYDSESGYHSNADIAPNQQIKIGEYTMQITSLVSNEASGFGIMYIPFFDQRMKVEFYNISIDATGELQGGEIKIKSSNSINLNKKWNSDEWHNFIISSQGNSLPKNISDQLITDGINLNGFDLFITEMTLSNNTMYADAVYLVEESDGSFIPFSRRNIGLSDDGKRLDLCNSLFMMPGEDEENNDPLFPIIIHGFNVDDGTGTYVSFDCDGFKEFNLAGEYQFNKTYFIPYNDSIAPPEKVIANFQVTTHTWGEFIAECSFNTTFEIKGANDVLFTVGRTVIDYSESIVIPGIPDTLESNGINTEEWRGIYVEHVQVQLPESFKLKNNERIGFSAADLVYDHSNGVTAQLFAELNMQGTLAGWSVYADTAAISVENSSITLLELLGKIHIPILSEPEKDTLKYVNYKASFDGDSAHMYVDLAGEYGLPFLDSSVVVLSEGSSIGIKKTSEGYRPFANLNGDIDVTAGDFNLDTLSFQNFAIPVSGIQDMTIQAFSFAGIEFIEGDSTDIEESESESEESSESLKGFPISIKNIGFEDGGTNDEGNELKMLAFTLAVNFTNPKLGLSAEGDFEVFGAIDPSKLLPETLLGYRPWEAFDFDHMRLAALEIDADLGGIALFGRVENYNDDPTYGKGFKGAFALSAEPGFEVSAVAQFGKVNGFRYWYADAKMISPVGIPLLPGVVGVFGFGGGAYYNMTQSVLPIIGSINDYNGTTMPNVTDNPGQTLSGVTYTPKGAAEGETLGLKATIVLGTDPDPKRANMDLTLGLEFSLAPNFGLRQISFEGKAFFMTPINGRKDSKIYGTTSIIYNHQEKLLSGFLNAFISQEPFQGQGEAHLRFNFRDKKDWYLTIGTPPMESRLKLSMKVGNMNGFEFNNYFMMGRLNSLPSDKRALPLLKEYHPSLERFQNLVIEQNKDSISGKAILLGANYSAPDFKKDWWIFRASASATVGFDVLITNPPSCNTATGIKKWYLDGRAYAALSAAISARVKVLGKARNFDIMSLEAAALMQVQLPNPSWMQANISGSYNILSGLIKGKFKADIEFGNRCISTNTNTADLVANIKVIGDIKPDSINKSTGVPLVEIYRNKLVVAAFNVPLNKTISFEESNNNTYVRPEFGSITTSPVINGNSKFINDVDGYPTLFQFEPSNLLTPNQIYKVTLVIKWKEKSGSSWKDILVNNKPLTETVTWAFKTGTKPDYLPFDAVFSQFPEYGALYFHRLDNPTGGGISLNQAGWGYLFNPKFKDDFGNEYERNFFLRIKELDTDKKVFESALAARPIPQWGQQTGCEEYKTDKADYSECIEDFIKENNLEFYRNVFPDVFIVSLMKILNYNCYKTQCSKYGKYAVIQPNEANSLSNIKNTSNRWGFRRNENPELEVSSRSNNEDKAIGFPDFSSAIQKNKTYIAEIVSVPIQNENISITTKTESSNYTKPDSNWVQVTTNTSDIEQTTKTAVEKTIFSFKFGTSQYDQFDAKIAASQWLPSKWMRDYHTAENKPVRYPDLGSIFFQSEFDHSGTELENALNLDPDKVRDYYLYSRTVGEKSYLLLNDHVQAYFVKTQSEPLDRYEALRLSKMLDLDGSYGIAGMQYSRLKPLEARSPQKRKVECYDNNTFYIGNHKFLFLSNDVYNDVSAENRMALRNNPEAISLKALFIPRFIRATQIRMEFYSYWWHFDYWVRNHKTASKETYNDNKAKFAKRQDNINISHKEGDWCPNGKCSYMIVNNAIYPSTSQYYYKMNVKYHGTSNQMIKLKSPFYGNIYSPANLNEGISSAEHTQ